jgi:hypothetical protein
LSGQLRGVPAVDGDLADVVLLAQFVDPPPDYVVVDDFTRCGVEAVSLGKAKGYWSDSR